MRPVTSRRAIVVAPVTMGLLSGCSSIRRDVRHLRERDSQLTAVAFVATILAEPPDDETEYRHDHDLFDGVALFEQLLDGIDEERDDLSAGDRVEARVSHRSEKREPAEDLWAELEDEAFYVVYGDVYFELAYHTEWDD